MTLEIIAGWDDREVVGYQVCEFSAIRRTSVPIRFFPLMEKPLRFEHLYTRPHEHRDGQLWDVISDAPMATSFACSRFLVPWLARESWALFCDFADMMFVADPAELFALCDERYAIMVVKRDYAPVETQKMDSQIQTRYVRKNWSSVILWNLDHPGTDRLTLDMVNKLPGRDLHRFCWLEDHEIGELPRDWNYLVGTDEGDTPKLLHWTEGAPFMPGYQDAPWSNVWLRELAIMDASRGRLRTAA